MDKFYRYSDFVERNKENKKMLGSKMQLGNIFLTVNKIRLMDDKKTISDTLKKYENPKLRTSCGEIMAASVIVEAVMQGHLVVSNASYLKKWKGFDSDVFCTNRES